MRFCLCVNIKFNGIGAARPRKTGATAEGRARATGTEKGGHGCGGQGAGDGVRRGSGRQCLGLSYFFACLAGIVLL